MGSVRFPKVRSLKRVPSGHDDMQMEPSTPLDSSGLGVRRGSSFEWRLFLATFLPLLLVYGLTAGISRPWHIDTLTNAITAWSIGMTGSPILPDHAAATHPDYVGNVGWIVDSPRGPISQYPPGAALTAAGLYAMWDQPMTLVEISGTNRPGVPPLTLPLPPAAPARVTAILFTALAAALVSLSIRSCGGTALQATASGLTIGLATGYWSVASTQLWQHGPASAAVAGGVYCALTRRYLSAGVAFGLAIVVRPHLAVIAAVIGLGIAAGSRSVGPAAKIALASGVGLASVLGFNWWVWGELTVSGGYGAAFTEQFLSGGLVWFLGNVFGALFDPTNGIVFISPFLLVLAVGLHRGWRTADTATRYAALGGLLYLLIQLRANRFSGGEGHFGYRYPLEALTAAAPLLFVTYRAWIAEQPMFKAALLVAVGVSVAIQMNGALWW
jgi:hypothetical protein